MILNTIQLNLGGLKPTFFYTDNFQILMIREGKKMVNCLGFLAPCNTFITREQLIEVIKQKIIKNS